jgi:hypothetical protein
MLPFSDSSMDCSLACWLLSPTLAGGSSVDCSLMRRLRLSRLPKPLFPKPPMAGSSVVSYAPPTVRLETFATLEGLYHRQYVDASERYSSVLFVYLPTP